MVSCLPSPESPSQFTLFSAESIKPSEQSFHPVTVEANTKAWSSAWLWKRPWGLRGHAGGIPYWCLISSSNLAFSGRQCSLWRCHTEAILTFSKTPMDSAKLVLSALPWHIDFPKYHLLVTLCFASPHLSLPVPTSTYNILDNSNSIHA